MKLIPLNQRFFEMINSIMYVFEKALKESGLSENYYRKEKSKGNRRLLYINHPTNKNYSLVSYETISEAHREKINARFGNPYNMVIQEPILSLIENNNTAEQFFLSYRINGEKMIPVKKIKQYARACAWLDLLKKIEDGRNQIIKDLGIRVPVFYKHLEQIITAEKINGMNANFEGANQMPAKFPTTYRKLRPKILEYVKSGPAIMVSKLHGNKVAAKIKDEISEAQLLTLIEDHRQLDDVLISMFYNTWATKNGYKIITSQTVRHWRKKTECLTITGREGSSAFNEKYIRRVKGLLPSVPLALAEHDDNNLDFLFSDESGNNFNRYVAICVIDSRTKLLLGKSFTISKKPQQWQMYHAWLDAMYYIRSLTGGWHLPFEIKADKWAAKSFAPFYNKIAKSVTPGHGNKQRGYIEQFFGSPLWKRAQKLISDHNWTGNNISAKFRGVNVEAIRNNEKNRPMTGAEAELMIENFFQLLRHFPDIKRREVNPVSKEEQFMEQWNRLHSDDKRPINDEQLLLTFGIKHAPAHSPDGITITNRGVEPQINGRRLSYDLPESWMYNKLIGAKVNVIYDPFDMSRVLCTNYDDIRFIASTAQLAPRALKDQYTGSRTFLNALLAEKKAQVNEVADKSAARKKIADTRHYNAEALLQGGVLLKELKNEAEHKMIEEYNSGYEEYLDKNNDFGQFFK